MSYLGKKARIKLNEKEQTKRGYGALNMGTNNPDADFSKAIGKECIIVGETGGQEYGDGMYDEALFILQYEQDGKKFSLRVPTEFVEIL